MSQLFSSYFLQIPVNLCMDMQVYAEHTLEPTTALEQYPKPGLLLQCYGLVSPRH